MGRWLPTLSKVMLILGAILILVGIGWGVWMRFNRPPAPVITDAGAVVLAETAPVKPTALPTTTVLTATPMPTATPAPTQAPTIEGPTPELLPEWTTVPKNAAGWHMNSALPGHGENVVLSGHHNVDGKVFRYVVDLSIGDEVTLYADGTPYTYEVSEKYILQEYGMPLEVRKKNAQWILPSGDERLTLVTCWPYEWPGYSHRVIVVAKPPSSAPVQVQGIE